MKRNKVISKILMPGIITTSVGMVLALSCIYALNKNAASQKKEHDMQSKVVFVANTVVIGLIAYLYVTSLLSMRKFANKFVNETIKKYINKEISKKPEYKQFESLLQNAAALNHISIIISNELRKSEQIRIAAIAQQFEFAHTEKQIENMFNNIIRIIDEHASIHPEFTDKIYSALIHESYNMYVKQKQNAR